MFNLFEQVQRTFFVKDSNSSVSSETEQSNESRNDSNTSIIADKVFNYAKSATSVVQEGAGRITHILNKSTIIGDFERQKMDFEKQLQEEKQKSSLSGDTCNQLPWSGVPNSELMLKRILALSLDERTFLSDSPVAENINFDQKLTAEELLEVDPRLAKMRYELVPKRVAEDKFWKNYFYRISLVQKLVSQRGSFDSDDGEAPAAESSSRERPCGSEVEHKDNEQGSSLSNPTSEEERSVKTPDDDKMDEDWEKELLNDLNEYELNQKSDAEFDEDIQALLEEEEKSKGSSVK